MGKSGFEICTVFEVGIRINSRTSDRNGWRPETGDKPIADILEFLMGKAAAYNMFLRQGG